MGETWKIPSKLAIGVICILLSGAISFNAWAVASVYNRPTEAKVAEMIRDKSPYNADRNMVLKALERVERSNYELAQAVTQLKSELVEWKTQTLRDR